MATKKTGSNTSGGGNKGNKGSGTPAAGKGAKKPTPRKATGNAAQPAAPAPFQPAPALIKQYQDVLRVDERTASEIATRAHHAVHAWGLGPDAVKAAAKTVGQDGKNVGSTALARLVVDHLKSQPDMLKAATDASAQLGVPVQDLLAQEGFSPGYIANTVKNQTKQAADAAGVTPVETPPPPKKGRGKKGAEELQTNVDADPAKRAPSSDADIGDLPEEDGEVDVPNRESSADLVAAYAAMLGHANQAHVATLQSIELGGGRLKVTHGVGKDVNTDRMTKQQATAGAADTTPATTETTTQSSGTVQPSNANASRLDRGRNHAAFNAMGFTDDDIRRMSDKDYADSAASIDTGFLSPTNPKFAERSKAVQDIQRQWKQEDWDKSSWAPKGTDIIRRFVGKPLHDAAKWTVQNAYPIIGGGAVAEELVLPMLSGGKYGAGLIRVLRGSQDPQQEQSKQPMSQPTFDGVPEDESFAPIPGLSPAQMDNPFGIRKPAVLPPQPPAK